MTYKQEITKLKELCVPVVEYLKENHNLNTRVIISDDFIRLVKDEIGIPIIGGENSGSLQR